MKNILLFCSYLLIVCSCQNENTIKDYSISTKSNMLSEGKVLFSKDDNCYLYDLKITDNFYLFLDEKNDTVLRIYEQDNILQTSISSCRSSEKDKLWKPLFTKEIHAETEDIAYLVDNNTYYKAITLDANNSNMKINTIKPLKQRNMFSRDFNITTKETFGIPISRDTKCPFYFFNPDSGYYWVDPSPALEKKMPNDVFSYTNTICLNESQNTVVSAYRFTNYVSFYGLDGTLKTTVKFGETPVIPITTSDPNKIDIRNTSKCFTYICGTAKYVYCLYEGSSDFANQSKIVVFQWDGKHINTWQADRNLQAIAVDKNDKYILAISRNKNDGQDIIRYYLSKH